MRKHSARKWLHFILDLLPVIILPVFALYEINHDHNEPITVEVNENIVVDFNQLIDNPVNASTNLSVEFSDGIFTFTNNTENSVQYPRLCTFDSFDMKSGHTYLVKKLGQDLNLRFWNNGSWIQFDSTSETYTMNYNLSGVFNVFYIGTLAPQQSITFSPCIFDLTQMGLTSSEFESTFTNTSYPYTLSEPVSISSSVVVYDNTDIGSQMMYALYKPVKEYFNFNNVFNFGDIYNWFELNIFGGTAPMAFFIVWNIVLYQFVMDLVFLIYGLFMWFIDMCEKLMDKPLNSIK